MSLTAERRLRHAATMPQQNSTTGYLLHGRSEAFTDGWRTPWVLANARPLQKPVRYKHPSGAVIWVNLDPRCHRPGASAGVCMNKVRKKLIEVSIPLEAINVASAREKSIRHGHPSTLHLWWARRPLAACRAVLFAQLVDDPSAWPERFPTEEAQDAERRRLHKVIERMVPWEASNDEAILNEARWEIARSVAWGLARSRRRKATARRSSITSRPRLRRSTTRSPAAGRSRWKRSGLGCAPTAPTSIRLRC